MFHHISIGVRSIAATKAFYDAALMPLGYTCLRARDAWLGYGKDRVMFSARASARHALLRPYRRSPRRPSTLRTSDVRLLTFTSATAPPKDRIRRLAYRKIPSS